MSNLFSSFDPTVTLILTTIIPALTSASCDPDVPIIIVEARLDSNSALSTNPTVTRIVTRSTQTRVNSSSNSLTSSLVTTLTTRGGAETITSSSSTSFPATLSPNSGSTPMSSFPSDTRSLLCDGTSQPISSVIRNDFDKCST